MKLIGVVKNKDIAYLKKLDLDGYLYPLDQYSCDYMVSYTMEEIKIRKKELKNKLCFVVLNRMFFNCDLSSLLNVLKELDQLEIDGVLFYDDCVLELVRENALNLPLIFSKTHMGTNKDTLNTYQNLGVVGAYLSNEITLRDILSIRKGTTLSLMVLLMGYPVVARSRRHLVKSYQKMKGQVTGCELSIQEPITKQHYKVVEDSYGTTFYYHKRLNASKCYQDYCDCGIDYGILLQDDLSDDIFFEITSCYKKNDLERVDAIVGKNRGFLYRDSIYRVKK